jgi:CO/xanthine dehydrogenase FAD-binding subunit
MKPAAFELFRPQSLDEALRLLAEHQENARLLAGGQSLVPLLNFRLAAPAVLIDLNRVAGLSGIRLDGRNLRIRAMTRQQELIENTLVAKHAPLLAAATRWVGHIQTRSRGTVGGSLAHADPSAELPAVLVALDARLEIQSIRGSRNIPVRSFFRDALVSDLAPDEVLVEIVIPCAAASSRYSFHELARRHGDFAIVAAAAQCDPPQISVALAGLEVTPRLCVRLMDVLRGNGLSRGGIEDAIKQELAAVKPNSDLQASGKFRIHLARVLLRDCLEEVLPA